jgi:hypothetical protein
VRFQPHTVIVGDRNCAGTQITEPGPADVVDLDAAEAPNARAICNVIDSNVRQRPDAQRRARGDE